MQYHRYAAMLALLLALAAAAPVISALGCPGQSMTLEGYHVAAQYNLTDYQVVYQVAASPSGAIAAVKAAYSDVYMLVLAGDGSVLWEDELENPVNIGHPLIVWSPDGSRVALVHHTEKITVYNAASGAEEYNWSDLHSIFSVTWTPEGKLLAATASGLVRFYSGWSTISYTVRVYDVLNDTEIYNVSFELINASEKKLSSALLSGDGRLLALILNNYTVWVYDIQSKSLASTTSIEGAQPLDTYYFYPEMASFSPDNKMIAIWTSEGVAIVDAENGGVTGIIPAPENMSIVKWVSPDTILVMETSRSLTIASPDGALKGRLVAPLITVAAGLDPATGHILVGGQCTNATGYHYASILALAPGEAPPSQAPGSGGTSTSTPPTAGEALGGFTANGSISNGTSAGATVGVNATLYLDDQGNYRLHLEILVSNVTGDPSSIEVTIGLPKGVITGQPEGASLDTTGRLDNLTVTVPAVEGLHTRDIIIHTSLDPDNATEAIVNQSRVYAHLLLSSGQAGGGAGSTSESPGTASTSAGQGQAAGKSLADKVLALAREDPKTLAIIILVLLVVVLAIRRK